MTTGDDITDLIVLFMKYNMGTVRATVPFGESQIKWFIQRERFENLINFRNVIFMYGKIKVIFFVVVVRTILYLSHGCHNGIIHFLVFRHIFFVVPNIYECH